MTATPREITTFSDTEKGTKEGEQTEIAIGRSGSWTRFWIED